MPCAFWVWLASLSIRLAVDTRACSSALSQARYAMTRVCLTARDRIRFFPPLTIRGGWVGLVVRGCALRIARTALIKIIYLISALHLPCAFWVWLASLSSRLAVDTRTCLSALSQARYAMTRVCLTARDRIRFFPPLTIREGWVGLVVRGCALRMAQTPLIKNIYLTSALHFSARSGYGSQRYEPSGRAGHTRRLPSGPPLGSFHHTRVLFNGKGFRQGHVTSGHRQFSFAHCHASLPVFCFKARA